MILKEKRKHKDVDCKRRKGVEKRCPLSHFDKMKRCNHHNHHHPLKLNLQNKKDPVYFWCSSSLLSLSSKTATSWLWLLMLISFVNSFSFIWSSSKPTNPQKFTNWFGFQNNNNVILKVFFEIRKQMQHLSEWHEFMVAILSDLIVRLLWRLWKKDETLNTKSLLGKESVLPSFCSAFQTLNRYQMTKEGEMT